MDGTPPHRGAGSPQLRSSTSSPRSPPEIDIRMIPLSSPSSASSIAAGVAAPRQGAISATHVSPAVPPTASPVSAHSRPQGSSYGTPLGVGSPAAPTNASSPLELLVQGKEQIVEVPLGTILTKVMATLKAKKMPVLSCYRKGMSGYQSHYDLQVSSEEDAVRIPGKICPTTILSNKSAAQSVFEYLEKNFSVRVLDYSSDVVENYSYSTLFATLNSSSGVLRAVLNAWSVAIETVTKFQKVVDNKEIAARVHGRKNDAALFSEVSKFLSTMLIRYEEKHRTASLYNPWAPLS